MWGLPISLPTSGPWPDLPHTLGQRSQEKEESKDSNHSCIQTSKQLCSTSLLNKRGRARINYLKDMKNKKQN